MFQKVLQFLIRPVSPADFTHEAEAYIHTQRPGAETRIAEPLQIEMRSDGEPVKINLHNAYIRYLQNRRARKEIIRHFVDALLSFDADRLLPKDIVPIIKDRAFLVETSAHLEKEGKSADDIFVTEDYNEELVILYAVDSPASIRYLTRDELAELDLRGEPLRSLAIDNLKRILPGVEMHGSAPLFALKAGGMFESSLLLLDRVWNRSELGIQGEILIAIPSRDVLLVADSSSPAAVGKLAKAAKEIAPTSAYGLTTSLFIRREQGFIPFSAGQAA